MSDLDFIDFAELKACAPETIALLEQMYIGARAESDCETMQVISNAIAALECIKVLPDNTIDQYKSIE